MIPPSPTTTAAVENLPVEIFTEKAKKENTMYTQGDDTNIMCPNCDCHSTLITGKSGKNTYDTECPQCDYTEEVTL